MIEKMPRTLPSVTLLLDDLQCSDRRIASALHCAPATVSRYRRTNSAPRPVHLALFWASRFGASEINADAVNTATLHAGMSSMLRTEVERLHVKLAKLERIADFGCANDPGVSSASRRPGSMPSALSLPQAPVSALRVTIPNAAPASRLK